MRPVLILSTAVLLLLAGCGGTSPPARPQPTPSGGEGTATVTTGPTSTTTPPPPTTTCGPLPLTATAGEQPTPRCLKVGAGMHITTEPSPHQPWDLPTSSDESILSCTARQLADGAADATCTALHPGTAIVTTTTAAFAGDPHGPPQSQWELHITVI